MDICNEKNTTDKMYLCKTEKTKTMETNELNLKELLEKSEKELSKKRGKLYGEIYAIDFQREEIDKLLKLRFLFDLFEKYRIDKLDINPVKNGFMVDLHFNDKK